MSQMAKFDMYNENRLAGKWPRGDRIWKTSSMSYIHIDDGMVGFASAKALWKNPWISLM